MKMEMIIELMIIAFLVVLMIYSIGVIIGVTLDLIKSEILISKNFPKNKKGRKDVGDCDKDSASNSIDDLFYAYKVDKKSNKETEK